jgi:hypothetical protein
LVGFAASSRTLRQALLFIYKLVGNNVDSKLPLVNRFIIIALIFSFLGCQNYDNEEYIRMENIAINDIVLEMTKFEEMKNLNEPKIEKLKLYIVSKLDTTAAWTIKPNGYDIGANGIDYTKGRIEENKKEFEEKLEEFELEEKLFIEFKKGKIKARSLNYSFENEKLNIELIDKEIIEKLGSFQIKENEFGYLTISRIIFNSDFTKGYLHFDFICGVGCSWNNNIEIIKINGKWKITKYFSGGIA